MMKRQPLRRHLPALMASSLAAVAPAHAAEDLLDLNLEDLAKVEVAVGSSKAESLLKSSSTVSVISRATLENYNFPSVSSAVDALAGISVTRTYLKQGLATSRGILQEHYANKVLVMINNTPTWHAVTGEGNLDRVAIQDVERIEVLRGPASVIYGSQAYAGAVNIVLRGAGPNTHSARFHAGLGTDSAYTTGASYRYLGEKDSDLTVALNTTHGQRLDYTFTDELGRVGVVTDFVDMNNLSATARSGRHQVVVNAYDSEEGYFGVTPRFAGGAGHPQDVQGVLAAYSYSQPWSERFDSRLDLFYDWSERNLSRTEDDRTRANVLGWRTGAVLWNNWTPSESVGVEFGADFDYRFSEEYANKLDGVVIADNNMSDQSVYETSLFGQAKWDVGPVRLVGGARLAYDQLFGENISARATAIWSLNEHNAVKLIAGQSFRAPSLFESYFATPDRTVFGNENLKPETVDSLEVAYQYTRGGFYAQATAYYAWYHDTIQRVTRDVTLPDGTVVPNASVYDNGSDFAGYGVELELHYTWPEGVDFFANLDVFSGTDDDRQAGADHYNFKYAPDYNLSAGVHKQFGPLGASLVGRFVGAMDGPVAEVDPHALLDLSVDYRHKVWRTEVRHAFAIRNLLDNDASVPEYVRHRTVNELPVTTGRGFHYMLSVAF